MINNTYKTCQYGSYDEMQCYVYINGESEYIADFVESNHSCIDYVTKEDD